MAVLDGIAFVDGAARAWPDRDAAEVAMLAELMTAPTPLTAITAAFGQLGAATTVIQAIALGELLRRGQPAPIARHIHPSTGPASPSTGPASPSAGPSSPSAGPASPSTGPASPSVSALGLSTGAPGLCAAIRVDVESGASR